jgi:hypothetical protein
LITNSLINELALLSIYKDPTVSISVQSTSISIYALYGSQNPFVSILNLMISLVPLLANDYGVNFVYLT